MNIAILIGYVIDEILSNAGVKLPLFVACLSTAIALTNVVPRIVPTLQWPSRTPSLALISNLSLNIFLAMSLMSMQLWTLGGVGRALVAVLGLQVIAATAYILLVVFPAMGRSYEAAVIALELVSALSQDWHEGGNALLTAIGDVVIALAVFDVAKYFVEEEVLRNRSLVTTSDVGRSLTKFISTIAIAVFIEGLVIVFHKSKHDVEKCLTRPLFSRRRFSSFSG